MKKRWACFLVALTACGPGRWGASDASSSSDTGADTTSNVGDDTESESEAGIECEPGKTWCDGECRVLTYNDEHCGECYHACETRSGTGTCTGGYCTPRVYDCITANDGFQTCADYCEAMGEQCAHDLDIAGNQCYGHLILHETPTCGSMTLYSLDPQTICEWPLPFGDTIYDGAFTVAAVECCCTQDNGA